MPHEPSASKPRRRRWGLFAPYVLVLAAALAWSGYWFVAKGRLVREMDTAAEGLRASGYDVAWKERRVDGFPFRLEVTLTDVRIAEPSGWGLASATFEAAANAYQPYHWVFVAPAGVSLSRPGAARVEVSAKVMRASLANADKAPRFSFEGHDLAFRSEPGPRPFPFTAAKLAEFHLRPLDGDRAEMLWRMQDAQTQQAGIFSRIAPLAPLNFRLAAELSRRGAFQGKDWADAVRAWARAGGSASVKQLAASVGEVSLDASGGPLTVGYDGRLRGYLAINLKQGASALSALGAAQAIDPAAAESAAAVAAARGDGSKAELRMNFEAGMTTIGPVRISAAPRVY